MTTTIIKLGGSLIGSDELAIWLKTAQVLAAKTDIVIVPGGGMFADNVRKLQKEHGFDERSAHNLALLAMCQTAHLLAAMAPHIEIVDTIEALLLNQGSNTPCLWCPIELTKSDAEIPASWDYTSDSIALWLAIKLMAERLFLIKSKKINNADSIEKHIENNSIDAGFKQLIHDYDGEVTFLEKKQYDLLLDYG